MPSPRDVPTYDLKPQMSAAEVTDELLAELETGDLDFVVVNYANADMVGHTGVLEAAIAPSRPSTPASARLVPAVLAQGGACLITADHGNSDHMIEPDGAPNTAHSTNPVPFLATVAGATVRAGGVLADIAPTILDLLGLPAPPEMTGRDLLAPRRLRSRDACRGPRPGGGGRLQSPACCIDDSGLLLWGQ